MCVCGGRFFRRFPQAVDPRQIYERCPLKKSIRWRQWRRDDMNRYVNLSSSSTTANNRVVAGDAEEIANIVLLL